MKRSLSSYAVGAGAAGADADNSFCTMSLIAFAASNPSVLSAGLLGSMPTKTMVGKPCICGKDCRSVSHICNKAYAVVQSCDASYLQL